jgi:hypothetical protein
MEIGQEFPNLDLSTVCQWMDWAELPDGQSDLKIWLSERLAWMMQNHPERMMQAFYRLDVSEAKVRQVLATSDSESWPGLFADLVIEREKQRAYWRAKYSKG